MKISVDTFKNNMAKQPRDSHSCFNMSCSDDELLVNIMEKLEEEFIIEGKESDVNETNSTKKQHADNVKNDDNLLSDDEPLTKFQEKECVAPEKKNYFEKKRKSIGKWSKFIF